LETFQVADLLAPTDGRVWAQTQIRGAATSPTGQFIAVLYKDALTPTLATTAAQLLAQECTFSGYARVPVAFPAAAANGAGDSHSQSPTLTFTHNGGGNADNVGGLAIVVFDGSGISPIALLLVKDFPAAIQMAAAGNTISRVIDWFVGQYPIS
jgi:hypothetical protein